MLYNPNVRSRTTIILCAVLTIFLCIPSLLRISLLLPFKDATVRSAAIEEMAQLRQKGWWMVNADFTNIDTQENTICFDWIYRYRSGFDEAPPRTEHLCIPKES